MICLKDGYLTLRTFNTSTLGGESARCLGSGRFVPCVDLVDSACGIIHKPLQHSLDAHTRMDAEIGIDRRV
jgi:hypothetical protein